MPTRRAWAAAEGEEAVETARCREKKVWDGASKAQEGPAEYFDSEIIVMAPVDSMATTAPLLDTARAAAAAAAVGEGRERRRTESRQRQRRVSLKHFI
jgi:hypothetical protein